ncbi:MAG: hypothetical protein WCF26_27975 [Candidatus Sulfotelmatobacter sp.]
MDDIGKDFLIESRENVDRLDQELVKLESDPASQRVAGQQFFARFTRSKGAAVFWDSRLEKVAHAGNA